MASVDDIYKLFLKYPRVTTDSRKVPENSIFFALKGEQFDGNDYAEEALNKGAALAVIDNPVKKTDDRYILVEDTLHALQELASLHRLKTRARIIGITGSNGKTTTKELIGKVLSSSFRTLITAGNLNNHIGVPLTLLSMTDDTNFAVVEMGANHPGEIAKLCRIARPDYGIITNIGKAHLEGFGSLEGVAKAKSELYDFIRQNSGHIFLNSDNDLLNRLSKGISSITYGENEDAFCKGRIIERDPFLLIEYFHGNNNGILKTKLVGEYNFENVLAALCVGLHFKVPQEIIESAVYDYLPGNNRSQLVNTGNNTVILDAYNANPDSMKAAILNFNKLQAEDKILIMGDMMELGHQSYEEHLSIVKLIRENKYNMVFLVGEIFSKASLGGNEISFVNLEESIRYLKDNPLFNKTILLKGSRRMQMENLLGLL